MSAAQVLTPLPKVAAPPTDDDPLFEIIDGVRVEMPPMSTNAEVVASELGGYLNGYGKSQNLGRGLVEVLFQLPLPADRRRRPDVAFVPYSEWPKGRPLPNDNGWTARPSLCVEVVSPTDRAEETREKVDEYLRAGVPLVWVVYPRLQAVDVYEAPNGLRFVGRDGELDGGAAVPGFRLPLADLFPAPPAEEGERPA